MKATLIQWMEFKSGFVWSDMRESVEAELRLLQIELENADTLDKVKHIQGKIIAMRHFLDLPDVAIEALQDKSVEQEDTNELG